MAIKGKNQPAGDRVFNVELRYLDEDVRSSFRETRDLFRSYHTGRVKGQAVVMALNDLRLCLIATSRYEKKEMEQLRRNLEGLGKKVADGEPFSKELSKIEEEFAWKISEQRLFKKVPGKRRSLKDRI